MEELLSVTLGGSVMIRVLLAVVAIMVVYALAKLISHCWRTYRTFRGLPYHPNIHWLWGHARQCNRVVLYGVLLMCLLTAFKRTLKIL